MPNAAKMLVDWLEQSFASKDLRNFLESTSIKPDLGAELPGGDSSLRQLAFAAVDIFERHHLFIPPFFSELAAARPMRVAQIVTIANAFGITASADLAEIIHAAAEACISTGQLDFIARSLEPLLAERPIGDDEITLAIQKIHRRARKLSSSPTVASPRHHPPDPTAPTTAEAYVQDVQALVAHDRLSRALRRLQDYAREVGGSEEEYRIVERIEGATEEQLARLVLKLCNDVHGKKGEISARVVEIRGHAQPADDRILALADVEKSYRGRSGRQFSLKCKQLSARAGHIVGVFGPNGSGKSTLLRIIAARLAPDGGRVTYPRLLSDCGGRSVDWRVLRRAIYFVPQRLEPWAGVIGEELHLHLARCGVTGSENERRVANAIKRLGLASVRSKSWGELSGGYQLRVELAKAVLSPVQLLVLDEPLAALDATAMAEVLALLRDLAADSTSRLTIVMASHILQEVEAIASFMVVVLPSGNVETFAPHSACVEVRGRFPAELFEYMRAEQCNWRTSDQSETAILIERQGARVEDLLRIFLDGYRAHGGQLESVRDVSRSLARFVKGAET